MKDKIYTFAQAFEIAEQLDEEGYKPKKRKRNDNQIQFLEMDNRKELDELYELKMDDVSDMLSNFQDFIQNVLEELKYIINEHPKALEKVILEFDFMGKYDQFVQVYFYGQYKDFVYEHVLVVTDEQWDNDREQIFKWVKAIILREYRKHTGSI